MSRRLRNEDAKLRQLKDEEEEAEDKYVTQQRRVKAPLFWKRTSSGFRIEDLKEKNFDEVLEIIKEHYMPSEVLCKNTELMDDEVSVNTYLSRVLQNLRDNSSIVAVDETYVKPELEEKDEDKKNKKGKKKDEDEVIKIAGVLILRTIHKDSFGRVFSRVQLVQGDAIKKCVEIKNNINRKVDVFTIFGCNSFVRIYDLCILPQYRNKGLGLHMVKCAIMVAQAMRIPVIMGSFTNHRLQKMGEKVGLKILYKINYVDWKDRQGDLIFDDPGPGNYSLALMAGKVPPYVHPVLPKPEKLEELERTKSKLTRVDRRIAASK